MKPNPKHAAILMALAASLLATACRKGQEKDGPGPDASMPTAVVRVTPVEIKGRMATEEVMGTIRARLRAGVEARVSGRIEKMLVVAGQTVRSGELLLELDSREARAKLDQALALRQQAENDLRRYTTLVRQQAVTQAEFDAMEARQRVAEAGVVEAETLVGHTRVVAPFDGVITRKLADVGDLASPGRPLLEIEDPRFLRVEANVPEALIDRVKIGTRLAVRTAAGEGSLDGIVSEITPVADPVSRTVAVRVDLPEGSGLRAGQFARVRVPTGESQALRVPASAVIQRGQMEIVFVVTNRQARLRLVKTGNSVDGEIELISGVSAGELVVTGEAERLKDGQPVEIKP